MHSILYGLISLSVEGHMARKHFLCFLCQQGYFFFLTCFFIDDICMLRLLNHKIRIKFDMVFPQDKLIFSLNFHYYV